MINLIFSFVFTTAKTNLFYARLQRLQPSNSRILELGDTWRSFWAKPFLSQTKKLSLRPGKRPWKAQCGVKGGFFPAYTYSCLSGEALSAPLSLNIPPSLPAPTANSCLASGVPSATSPVGTQ